MPIPDLRGGQPAVISAPCNPELKKIVQSLVERAEALRTGQIDPREDNMLLVTTDGRKAALDLRLHQPDLPNHPESKVNKAVGEIERIWRETAAERSTQLVFKPLRGSPTTATRTTSTRRNGLIASPRSSRQRNQNSPRRIDPEIRNQTHESNQ